ncbi:hypothetical protein [Deinococcus cellulosilyticus]|uniref:Uncharacterized protein n=1 Tax=Deinococcus cellulosilyticus (strain DSM 18568 / NBRC 106333 / KACC 11606 / 5516J-15) TaxID=1223518 RepID=A0A511MZ72_DEIC1|nr:hypothetical protein [Deinococcus cellulosilyticus]GEM45920.1 hypothetical protein DC3_15550 [Deinococcus cellulosilyticus NBRC 106333 = KACC 11606]
MTTEDTVEVYVLWPEGGTVICGRKRILNGNEDVRLYRAQVLGYSFPAIGSRVRLLRDQLSGGWVVS